MKENNNLEDYDFEDIDKAVEEHRKKLDLHGHLKELAELRQDNDCNIDDIVDSFCDRAKLLHKNNRTDDAIILLKEGLKYYPDQPKLICFIGFTCLSQESWEAQNYFLRALEINSEYPLAHYGLGRMQLELGENPEAAQRRYNLLMRFDPSLASKLKEQIIKFAMKRR